MQIIPPELARYAVDHSGKESESLQQLVRDSDDELQYIDMISGRVVGQLLSLLIKMGEAKNVLEIGTFTGYSALCMAEALPADGRVVTCDSNARYAKIARRAFRRSPYESKIELALSPALETISRLHQRFDLIFLDADKNNYPAYYEAIFPLLSAGGILVIDNVLWEGKVLEQKDKKSRAIHQLNETIARDERMQPVMLTVRDGVTVARKH